MSFQYLSNGVLFISPSSTKVKCDCCNKKMNCYDTSKFIYADTISNICTLV